jgi:hypothetical protein
LKQNLKFGRREADGGLHIWCRRSNDLTAELLNGFMGSAVGEVVGKCVGMCCSLVSS